MTTHTTTSIVIGLFESRAAAEQAVNALVKEDYDRSDISIVASDTRDGDIPNIAPVDSPGSFDAGTGAAIGGLAGFVGGIIALAIPGIGPILAAGPLAAGIMGAGLGAATGGVIGALKQHGVPENDAARVAEAIRRGRVMVTAHVPHDKAHHAADLMEEHGAVDTEEAEDIQLEPGNDRVTPVKPLTPEAVEAARLKPGESLMEKEKQRERRVYVYPGITGMGSGPND